MFSKNINQLFWNVFLTLAQISSLPILNVSASEKVNLHLGLQGNTVTILSSSNTNSKLTLLILGKNQPVKLIVNGKTLLECICYHCNMVMDFTSDSLSSSCQMCPCDASNAECITGLNMKKKSSIESLSTLPKGTQMRAVWDGDGNPDAGLSRLIIDRRGTLLPVDIDCNALRNQITEAIKPMGGELIEIGNEGKVLQIKWNEDWTPSRSTKLEKILAKLNIHFAFLKMPDRKIANS